MVKSTRKLFSKMNGSWSKLIKFRKSIFFNFLAIRNVFRNQSPLGRYMFYQLRPLSRLKKMKCAHYSVNIGNSIFRVYAVHFIFITFDNFNHHSVIEAVAVFTHFRLLLKFSHIKLIPSDCTSIDSTLFRQVGVYYQKWLCTIEYLFWSPIISSLERKQHYFTYPNFRRHTGDYIFTFLRVFYKINSAQYHN